MAAAAAGEPPIYLILGHGHETMVNFNDRERLPEGYSLVTYSESGNASFMDEVCKTVGLFQDESQKDMLSDPRENKDELERALNHPVHVYKPGHLIPSLDITSLTSWSFSQGRGQFYQFMRSGVFTFPLQKWSFRSPYFKLPKEKEDLLATNENLQRNIAQCGENIVVMDWSEFKGNTLDKLYEGAVYPSEEKVKSLSKYDSIQSTVGVGSAFSISLADLMKKLGPGVYYYVICRADNEFYGKHSTLFQTFFSIRGIREGFDEDFPDYWKGEEGAAKLDTVKAFEKEMAEAFKDITKENNIQAQIRRFIRFLYGYPVSLDSYTKLPTEYKKYFDNMHDVPKPEAMITEMNTYAKKVERARRLSIAQQDATHKGGRRRGASRRRRTRRLGRRH
jgi:hypothetical protein